MNFNFENTCEWCKRFLKVCFEWIKHFYRVSKEFVITVFFSMFPIIVGSVGGFFFTKNGFAKSFLSYFDAGEVFLYTSAFLTPYITNKIMINDGRTTAKGICFVTFLYSFFAGALVYFSVKIQSISSVEMFVKVSEIPSLPISIVFSAMFTWYYSVWPSHKEKINTKEVEKKQQDKLNSGLNDLINGNK